MLAATSIATENDDDNDMEYNDDYDDQYDGVGMGGATDSGLYAIDFDSIKAYNKVTKDMEADRLYWEESRNDNRSKHGCGQVKHGKRGSKNNKDNGNDSDAEEEEVVDGQEVVGQKKYRGLDKGKGGILIGPDGKYLPHPKSRKTGGEGGGGKVQSSSQSQSQSQATTSSKKKNANQKESNQNNNNTKNKDGKDKDELSKIQKRRKNDNKANIANHDRKERALKKTGM